MTRLQRVSNAHDFTNEHWRLFDGLVGVSAAIHPRGGQGLLDALLALGITTNAV